jgi:two-component system, NarL family, nitrate/nitrite response regulator NarL
MHKPIVTVLIAPNAFFREGLVSILAPTRYRVHSAAHERDALRAPLPKGRQMLFIVATDEDVSAIAKTVAALRSEFGARIIVLASICDARACREVLRAGAAAYLPNTTSADALFKCLDLVLASELVVVLPEAVPDSVLLQDNAVPEHQPKIADKGDGDKSDKEAGTAACDAGVHRLSHREREILHCVVSGDSNKHIGRRYEIAEATVKVHMKAILRKIGVRNRTQAAIWAVSHLRADPPSPMPFSEDMLPPRTNGQLPLTSAGWAQR